MHSSTLPCFLAAALIGSVEEEHDTVDAHTNLLSCSFDQEQRVMGFSTMHVEAECVCRCVFVSEWVSFHQEKNCDILFTWCDFAYQNLILQNAYADVLKRK